MPIDLLVDQGQRLITLGVVDVACRLAIDSASFDRAAANLHRSSGLSLSSERLRQLVEQEGKVLLQAQRQGQLGDEQLKPEFSAAQCTTQRPDGKETTRVYGGMDGVKVPVTTQAEKDKRRAKAKERRKRLRQRKESKESKEDKQVRRPPLAPLPPMKKGCDERYKEFKIVTFYNEEHQHRYVEGTCKDCQAAGKLLARAAADLGLRGAAEKVMVADGADWIWNQIERRLPYVDAKVLDFYHLSEHVHGARRVVFGEEDEGGKDWAGRVLHVVRHEGYEPFWSMLVEQRGKVARSGSKRKAMDALMHYVAERKELMDYRRCEQMGWDVGSGSTESMCGAMTRRLKLRGMRWDRDNAEAMMALESLEQSNGWSAWLATRAASLN